MGDLVTFEVAKKLKEKGFMQKVVYYYNEKGKVNVYKSNTIGNIEHSWLDFRTNKNMCESIPWCDAPTISQVLKWLREEKDIDLVINPVFFYDDLGRMREYGCKVFAPSLNKPEHCGYHEEWEQASLAGIEYAIDNLI